MKLFYDVGYKHFTMPWEGGPRSELVALVESGRLRPCHALDLGCGTGANAVFLAERGFEVTGVDFSRPALAKAARLAERQGVDVRWVDDDLTRMANVNGVFDLLIDYGALDDLGALDRDRYLERVVPLARRGAEFLLWCFEWAPRRWERFVPFAAMAMAPGEVERRFGEDFAIEKVASGKGYGAYLMTRL